MICSAGAITLRIPAHGIAPSAFGSLSYPDGGMGPQVDSPGAFLMAATPRKHNRQFTERFELLLPRVLPSAIRAAAARNMMSPSEYVRRSVIDRLKADGIDPSTMAAA